MGLKKMNISHYDFHDGYLLDIKHTNDAIEISMESAQIDLNDNKLNIILTNNKTLRGKLHIEGIKEIKINKKPFDGKLKKLFDEGDIYSFNIENNKISLIICWINHSHENPSEDNMWYSYEIDAEKVYWENIPTLCNPYWL